MARAQSPAPAAAEVRGKPGFWQLAKSAGGRWWFIDPRTGREQFLLNITTVQPFILGLDRGAKKWDYEAPGINPANPTDAALRTWADDTAAQIKAIGFTGIGAWCHPAIRATDIPRTLDLNLWLTVGWPKYQKFLIYDPAWPAKLDELLTQLVDPLRDDKNLIGYYVDNELVWSPDLVGANVYFSQPQNSPQRVEVLKVISQVWPTIEAFNKDWGTTFNRFEDIATWKLLPDDRASSGVLESAWLSHVSGDYFKLVTEAVRRHDPNHLLLGVKFHALENKGHKNRWFPAEVIKQAGRYFDAHSLDYYPDPTGILPTKELDLLRSTGLPTIISEYSIHSDENRSFDMNTAQYPAVKTQAERAALFTTFTKRLAGRPEIVAAEWFQWVDQPPSGRYPDGEDVAFGFLDLHGKPYEEMAAALKALVPTLNDVHRGDAKP